MLSQTLEIEDEIDPRQQLWQMGIVSSWYLRPSQKDVYALLRRERFAFIEAARRFGKTTSILAFVLEKLLQNPGWICRWCFPNKNQAREVLIAEIAKMQSAIDERDRFHYTVMDSVFQHSNGSKLFLRGVNEDRGDSARGPAANIIIADEYGFWIEPDYIIRECLSPQLQGQEGRWLIKASTPPRNLGHQYYVERDVAERRGRFIQKIIYDNEALGAEELQEIIDECGGLNSPSFQRERLCMPVSDPDMLICPEFLDTLDGNLVPDDYPRPEFYTPYVGGDSGADDNTAVLFGYHDFIKNELVIEEELILNGKTTSVIIEQAKKIENDLWPHVKVHKRVYDAPKQLIYDIYTDHAWPVWMPQKDDKHGSIHEFRVEVGARRVKIKERCRQTRKQLKVGMWKDERHSDFERTEGLGHLDAVAAAIYLNRCIDRRLNPYPVHYGLSKFTHHINPSPAVSQGTTEKAFESLLGSNQRGTR